MQTAGGIQKNHVIAALAGVEHRLLGSLDRILSAALKYGNAQFLAAYLQLLNSGGAINIAGNQQGITPLTLHQAGKLASVGGLTCTLEAHQHHHSRPIGVEGDVLGIGAHELDQFLVDDLHDHLRRGKRLQYIRADTALSNCFGKILADLIADVSLQQGHADFAHGFLHVCLFQPALAAKLFEGIIDFFR